MGVRGELFSNKVILQNRTYFFNVKENRMGDLYLNIVESKNKDSGGFDRQSVILFADDLQEFLKGFDESLKVLEKSVREKRHTGKTTAKHGEAREEKKRSSERNAFGDDHGSDRKRERSSTRSFERSGDYGGERKERGRKTFGEGDFPRSRTTERGERGRKPFGEREPARSRTTDRGERGRKPFGERESARSRTTERSPRDRKTFDDRKPAKSRRSESDFERKPPRAKRVVVRKRD